MIRLSCEPRLLQAEVKSFAHSSGVGDARPLAVPTPKSASAAAATRSDSTSALATPPRPLSPSQASGEVAPKAALKPRGHGAEDIGAEGMGWRALGWRAWGGGHGVEGMGWQPGAHRGVIGV